MGSQSMPCPVLDISPFPVLQTVISFMNQQFQWAMEEYKRPWQSPRSDIQARGKRGKKIQKIHISEAKTRQDKRRLVKSKQWQTDVRPTIPHTPHPYPPLCHRYTVIHWWRELLTCMIPLVNEARALRVTEIMQDYQEIQRRIAAYDTPVPTSSQNEAGYLVLRQARAEARSLLGSRYPEELLHPPRGSGETQKRQLQR